MRETTEELLGELEPHAVELGCAEQLEGIAGMLREGNGALRQQMVFEANRDLHELMHSIVERTEPDALHVQEVMDEDDAFESVAAEVW